MAAVMIFKSGDLPRCCTEAFFKPRVIGCLSGFTGSIDYFYAKLHSHTCCENTVNLLYI